MNGDAVETIGDGGAGGTAGGVIGAKHEVVDDDLRPASKKVNERGAPILGVEPVFFVDPDPWQLLSSPRQLVASAGKLLLSVEELLSGGDPFLARNDLVFRVNRVGAHF